MARGLEKQAEILQEIKTDQQVVQKTVGIMLQDKANEESIELYGIKMTKGPKELGKNEKQALCAALYTLMEKYDQCSDYQRTFYINLEKYLGMTLQIPDFNF